MLQTASLISLILLGNMFMILAGWQHPEESNMATYTLWLTISLTYFYTSLKLRFPMALAYSFIAGNLFLISFALIRGGYTFNLGPGEYTALFSLVAGISCWATYGAIKKKWNERILLIGLIGADILSFYPQNKQYFGPHETPSYLLFLGFGTWTVSMLFNIIFIDKFFRKLRDGNEKAGTLILNSAISIENFFLLLITMYVMGS